jgi:hypothetical protein
LSRLKRSRYATSKSETPMDPLRKDAKSSRYGPSRMSVLTLRLPGPIGRALVQTAPNTKREPVDGGMILPGMAASARRVKVRPLQCMGTR